MHTLSLKRMTAAVLVLLLLLPLLSYGVSARAAEEGGSEAPVVETPAEPDPVPEPVVPDPTPEPASEPAAETPTPDTPSASDSDQTGGSETSGETADVQTAETPAAEVTIAEDAEEDEDSIFTGGGTSVSAYTVLNSMMAQGFSAQAACGVLASIWTESGFYTGATNQTDGGFGLFQWTYSRRDNLEAYCVSTGSNPYSYDVQIAYLMYELQNSYANVYNYMTTEGHTAYEYGYVFSKGFEGDYEEYNRQVALNTMAIYSAYRDHGEDFASYVVDEGRRSAGVVASVAVLSYSDEAPEITFAESGNELVDTALPLALRLNYQLTDNTKWDQTFVIDQDSSIDDYLSGRLSSWGGTAAAEDDLFTRYLSVCAADCGLCSWQFAVTGSAAAQLSQLYAAGSRVYKASDVTIFGGEDYTAVPGDLAVLAADGGYRLALVVEVTEDYIAVLEFDDGVPMELFCGEGYSIVDSGFQIAGDENCWLLDEHTKIIHPQTVLSVAMSEGDAPVYRTFRLNENIRDTLTASARGCTPAILWQYSLDGRSWISVPEDFVTASEENTSVNDGLAEAGLDLTALTIQISDSIVDGHFWVRADTTDTSLEGQRVQYVVAVYEPEAVNEAEIDIEDTAETQLAETEELFGDPPLRTDGMSGVSVEDQFPVYADRLNFRVWQWVFAGVRMPIEY